ncbi:MAG: nucleotide exchange factor GrpE [bacterium]
MDRNEYEPTLTPTEIPPDSQPIADAEAPADWREGILSDFRTWLYSLTDDEAAAPAEGERLDDEATDSAPDADEPDADEPGDAAPDLETLFGELAALRQETRLVGRASQQAERQLGSLAESLRAELREQNERLVRTTADLKTQLPAARREAQGAVLTELLAIRAALEDTVRAARRRTLPSRPWLGTARKLLQEGTTSAQMALDKADDALRRLSIAAVAEPGVPFDPKWMRAVAAVTRADRPAGTVVTVVRQGWRREDQLLQTADVEVSKAS